jgi:hypothetical protein
MISMNRALKALLVVRLLAYPILPTSPRMAGLIAWLMGPPFVVGTNASGWPIIGTITPLLWPSRSASRGSWARAHLRRVTATVG